MGVTVIISFQVEDLDEWKTRFDSDVNNREASGIHATAYRELDDSHRVQVIGTAPSRQAFERFFQDPELQKRIKDSGLTGPPEITFLETV